MVGRSWGNPGLELAIGLDRSEGLRAVGAPEVPQGLEPSHALFGKEVGHVAVLSTCFMPTTTADAMSSAFEVVYTSPAPRRGLRPGHSPSCPLAHQHLARSATDLWRGHCSLQSGAYGDPPRRLRGAGPGWLCRQTLPSAVPVGRATAMRAGAELPGAGRRRAAPLLRRAPLPPGELLSLVPLQPM